MLKTDNFALPLHKHTYFFIMEYNNSNIRRQDRLLSEDKAYKLLRNGEYGILSMLSPENVPYAVPVNYVWNDDDAIYIHCAPEGKKLLCIHHNPSVSFCVVGDTHVISDKFTTNYESIVLSCHAEIGLSAEERMYALHKLIEKYAPQFKEIGKKYAENSFHRTEIIKLNILSFSGKSKNMM